MDVKSWQGLLELASKLDAPGVLRVRAAQNEGRGWGRGTLGSAPQP